jgi:hypothetical protein
MSSKLMKRRLIQHSNLRYRDRGNLKRSSLNRVKLSMISYNSKFKSYLQVGKMKRQRGNC